MILLVFLSSLLFKTAFSVYLCTDDPVKNKQINVINHVELESLLVSKCF